MEDEVPILAHEQAPNDSQSINNAPVVTIKSRSRFMTFYELIKLVFSAELSLFLYCVAFAIFAPAQQKFVYDKICMFKYNSSQICSNIDTEPSLVAQEGAVQADFTSFSSLTNFVSTIPCIFITLIMGTWADRFSYRLPLAIPHLGFAAMTACYLAFAYLPVETLDPVYYGTFSLLSGLTGSASTCIVACAAYISRISDGHNRTVRLAGIEVAITLGQMAGYFLSALILKHGSPSLAFIIQIAINIYTIVFVFFMVRELHKFRTVKAKVESEAGGSWLKFIFKPRLDVVDGFSIYFGTSQKYRGVRRYLITMLIIFLLPSATMSGVGAPFYGFLTMQPISISISDYAILNAVSGAGASLALFIGMRMFRRCCGLSDAALLIIGLLSRTAVLIGLGFGDFYPKYVGWIYCGLSIFNFYPFVTIRSGMSKLTDEAEHGRLFSALTIFDNIVSLLVTFGFNALYAYFVSTSYQTEFLNFIFHGFTFIVAAEMCIVAIIFAIWLGRKNIKNWSFNSNLASNAVESS